MPLTQSSESVFEEKRESEILKPNHFDISSKDDLFESKELSKLFTLSFPEIEETMHKDVSMIKLITHAIFTKKQEYLLRIVERLTNEDVRELYEDILITVEQKEIEITDLKDLDIFLAIDSDSMPLVIPTNIIEQRCAALDQLKNG